MPPAKQGADSQDSKDLEQPEQSQPVVKAPLSKKMTAFEKLKASLPAGKPINVVALQNGLYKQVRRAEGDKFTIDSREQLGTWMKPI